MFFSTQIVHNDKYNYSFSNLPHSLYNLVKLTSLSPLINCINLNTFFD
nr:MAG TPA: hypothetical protein [Caudoviricetes sp.]